MPGDADLLSVLPAAAGPAPANGRVALPEAVGSGYIQHFDLGPGLRLMIHAYELKQDVRLRKTATSTKRDTIVFSFRNLFQQRPDPSPPGQAATRPATLVPTVRVASADREMKIYAAAYPRVNVLLIAAEVDLFADLLPPLATNELVQTVRAGGQSLSLRRAAFAPNAGRGGASGGPGRAAPLLLENQRLPGQPLSPLWQPAVPGGQ